MLGGTWLVKLQPRQKLEEYIINKYINQIFAFHNIPFIFRVAKTWKWHRKRSFITVGYDSYGTFLSTHLDWILAKEMVDIDSGFKCYSIRNYDGFRNTFQLPFHEHLTLFLTWLNWISISCHIHYHSSHLLQRWMIESFLVLKNIFTLYLIIHRLVFLFGFGRKKRG